MPTEQQVAAACLAAANAALPASVRAYEPSKVPSRRPAEYVTVTLAERTGAVARSGRIGWLEQRAEVGADETAADNSDLLLVNH